MGTDGNERLRMVLRHYIDLEYYANGVSDDIMVLFEELGRESAGIIGSRGHYGTKDAYSAAYRLLREKCDSFGTSFYERLESEAEAVRDTEIEFLTDAYGFAAISVPLSRILFAPVDGRDTARSLADRTKRNILRSYDNALRAGYMFGLPTGEIIEQAERAMRQVSSGMRSGIRTAIPSFAKTTDRVSFRERHVPVMWVATLDGNQCLGCTSLSGTVYESVSKVVQYPLHNLCRCVLVPVSEVPDPIPTYEEYIRGLSDSEQYHVLGKNRYGLYKYYGIPLERFVNNGEVVRLDELRNPSGNPGSKE